MDFLRDLTGHLLWATLVSVILFVAGAVATGFLAKKSDLLKPIGTGLKLIVLFIAIQVFRGLGAAELYPRLSTHLNFYAWIILLFAIVKLSLYIYGDLFVVRWRSGSFPAAFKKIITIVVIVVGSLVLLKEILNINVTSLIATTTVLTATVGLAFQSTLANMLAGLTIHLEKTVKQGDWIAVSGHEGKVLDITLRSTRLLTIEHNQVSIPNSQVLNDAVVNFSMPSTTTIRTLEVGVSYSIPPNRVKDALLEILASNARVRTSPAPVVRVKNYGDFSIHYEIRYAPSEFGKHVEIEADIMDLLWYRFRRDNIEIPFPVRNVNLTQITPEMRESDEARRTGEIMNLLRRVEIFSHLSKGEQGDMVNAVRIKPYAAGETPVHQGAPGDSFYIIKSGKVDVIVEKAPGESTVVATLGPGNFFGEMSLLTGAVRTASIRVVEDAEFIVIDRENFRSVLAENPSIAESLSHVLAERQAKLDAERERLDASALDRRKKDEKGRLLKKISEFFGLAR